MIVKLPTEHYLEFLILKGGCRGLSVSTLVKMSNCWKSSATAHLPSTLLRVKCSLLLVTLEVYNFTCQQAFSCKCHGRGALHSEKLCKTATQKDKTKVSMKNGSLM